jgi:hypothetical protein
MEITMTGRCVYHDDFDGALYYGFVADIIHRTLEELEGELFICLECKRAKFRSKELLNEHVYEEHGKQ